MHRPILYILLCIIIFSSCRVIEPVGNGHYYGPANSSSRLQLNADSTFELAMLDPARDSLLFPGLPFRAFWLTGKWARYGKDHWTLLPDMTPNTATSIDDSISRFTTINSFSFWDKYGAPVNIRSIRFGRTRPKPHYGNSLYFFAQDFYEADTVHFEMDGYDEFRYPGSIPWAIGNNGHKITLIAGTTGYLRQPIRVTRKRNKLYFQGSKKALVQK